MLRKTLTIIGYTVITLTAGLGLFVAAVAYLAM